MSSLIHCFAPILWHSALTRRWLLWCFRINLLAIESNVLNLWKSFPCKKKTWLQISPLCGGYGMCTTRHPHAPKATIALNINTFSKIENAAHTHAHIIIKSCEFAFARHMHAIVTRNCQFSEMEMHPLVATWLISIFHSGSIKWWNWIFCLLQNGRSARTRKINTQK